MESEFGLTEPGVDKTYHLLIAFYAPELVHGVFKEDIWRIDVVGLVSWEALIVFFEDLDNVHRIRAALYSTYTATVGYAVSK